MQPTVTEAHVRRALDLFTVSTMDAVKSGVTEAVVSTSCSSDWYLVQSGSALKHPWAPQAHCARKILQAHEEEEEEESLHILQPT